MNWKNSDLRKLLAWLLTFFEEDNGKASMKRLICVVLAATCAHAIIHTIRNFQIAEWSNGIYFLITLFGMIASLLSMTYIPSRKEPDAK